ncbi:MAG: RidA family protein [Candidatus Micropelagos thuwalensis]|jgi:enamine deaminase RidA (YjgF/YER057c/UK114 family)
MLPRAFITPNDHWSKKTDNPISQAVRVGNFLFIAGQISIDRDQNIFAPYNILEQTKFVMEQIISVLSNANFDIGDLVQLRGFYASGICEDEYLIEKQISFVLGELNCPGPVLTLVPMPTLRPEGIVIQIEAIAMRGQNGEILSRTVAWDSTWSGPSKPFSQALKVANMIFTSGITAHAIDTIPAEGDLAEQCHLVMHRIDRLLSQLGACFDDVVKSNIYNAESGTKDDWARPALIRASYYNEPGPAATGISAISLFPKGIMTKKDVVAMINPNGTRIERQHVWPNDHWDWTIHLPYRHGLKAGDLVFLGGQVPLKSDASVAYVGDISKQTEMSMEYISRILEELGMDFTNIVRMNTFFVSDGKGPLAELEYQKNFLARNSFFHSSPPVFSDIQVPYLAYEEMNIEIDVIAVA